MSYSAKAVKGTATVLILSILSISLGYFSRVLFARNLTVAEYGLMNTILAFLGLAVIFKDFGLASSFAKFIPELVVKEEFGKIKYSIQYVLLVKLAITSILTLTFIVFSRTISIHVFRTDAAHIFILFALNFFIYTFVETISPILVGFQNQKYYSLSDFIRVIVIFFSALLFFRIFEGVIVVASAYLIASLTAVVVISIFLYKTFPQLLSAPIDKDRAIIVNFWKYGISSTLAFVGGSIIGHTDMLMLTQFKGLEQAGYYGIALPLAYALLIFSTAASTVMLPMVSELHTKKMSVQIIDGISMAHKYMLICITPIVCAILVFPGMIITILFGSTYLPAATAFQILSVGVLFSVLANINMSVIVGIGKPWQYTATYLAVASLNIALNLYFIPRMGIAGAALATAISFGIIFALSVVLLKKNLGYMLRYKSILQILISNGVFLAILKVVATWPISSPLLKIAIGISLASVAYALALLLLRAVVIKDVREFLATHFLSFNRKS